MRVEEIDKKFFKQRAVDVAQGVLGAYLVRRLEGGSEVRSAITEVEAYVGEEDKACHAHKGKTKRTATMFEEGGVFYIYLIYGMYYMLNIVTGEKDNPEAVLIRGVKDISGPGRLTRDLNIDRSFNGLEVGEDNNLWIEGGESPNLKNIKRLPRVGVGYAGEWANEPLRFIYNID